MTVDRRQPIIRFRVPHPGFVEELRVAARSLGESPSQFIRRAIADRISLAEHKETADDS